MKTRDLSAALEAWAVATCPDLTGSYDFSPAEQSEPLPAVVAEPVAIRDAHDDPDFRVVDLQQVDIRVWDYRLLVIAALGDTPDEVEASAHQLEDFADALMDAAQQDPSLGGRVHAVARVSASFDPPVVQFDDDSLGRQVTVQLSVGRALSA